jgi:hypothetical protein
MRADLMTLNVVIGSSGDINEQRCFFQLCTAAIIPFGTATGTINVGAVM